MPNICLSVTRYTAPVARRERLAISPVHSVVTLNKTSAAKAAGAEHPRRPGVSASAVHPVMTSSQ